MRSLVGILLLLLAAPTAAAFDYQLNIGDIGEQPQLPPHVQGAPLAVLFVTLHPSQENETHVPVGGITGPLGPGMLEPFCSCGFAELRPMESGAILVVPPGPPEQVTVGIAQILNDPEAFTHRWVPPTSDVDSVTVRVAAREGQQVLSAYEATTAQEGDVTVHTFDDDALRTTPAVFAVVPSAIAPTASDSPATVEEAGTPWLLAVGAFLAGILLWALLVQRGVVQRRSRKQSVAQAGHKAAAAAAPRPVLEARLRALKAALKDLEKAKMQGEVDTAAYDTVKADLKQQAVTTMRALEEPAAA